MINLKIPSENEIRKILEDLINQIPKGKVTTFKTLANALGSTYATRYVASILKSLNAPIWRVVNEKGGIKDWQREKLLKEGVEVKDNRIDINKYLFKDFNIKFKPLEYLRDFQKKITSETVLEDKFKKLELIAGLDLSYEKNIANVVLVLLDKNLNLIDYKVIKEKIEFPYIPSFLAFREGPAGIKAVETLEEKPDVLFVNGHGIAHPVRLGLATFIGYFARIPTIGVTKSLLCGEIRDDKIILNNEQVGWVIKKENNVCYVSPGNFVSLKTAKELSEKFWIKGRYPEPIRLADEISKKVKNKNKSLEDYFIKKGF